MTRMGKLFEQGVSWYAHGRMEIDVYFPEGNTTCQWCPFCRNEDSLKRWKCLITGEYLMYPFTSRGNKCPLKLEEEEGKTDGSQG